MINFGLSNYRCGKTFRFEGNPEPFVPQKWLNGGDIVTIGNEKFKVEHCPGHTPGRVAFINEKAKIAIVGDLLFSGSMEERIFQGVITVS
jgi:glyoxylase-like metal-dependent hydrolase (beta-lactamase superfamily II)